MKATCFFLGFILFLPLSLTLAQGDDIPDNSVLSLESDMEEKEAEELADSGSEPLRDEFGARVMEVLAAIEAHCPDLAAHIAGSDGSAVLKAMVEAMDIGIEYLSAGEIPLGGDIGIRHGKAVAPDEAVIIAGQQVLYLRMNNFSEDSVNQAISDAAGASRLARPPVGVIIDLRNAGGSNYAGATRVLHAFCPAEKLPVFPELDLPERELKLPLLVLLGGETRGAAEVFAYLAEHSGGALTLGGESAGEPFPRRRILLSNGDLLRVPVIPVPLLAVLPRKIKPAVTAKAYPQIEFEKLRGEAGAESGDACLLRAVDLLVSLAALQRYGEQ